MPKIHAELRAALTRALTEILAKLPVSNGFYVPFEGRLMLQRADKLLPEQHKQKPGGDPTRNIKPALVEMIDDHPIADFAEEYLNVLIQKHSTFDLERPDIEFAALLPEQDLSIVAADIVQALSALPYQYSFILALPPSLAALVPDGSASVFINPKMRLMRASEEFIAKYPTPDNYGSLSELFGRQPQRDVKVGGYALQLDAEGFSTRYGNTATVMDAILSVKAFFGFCVALRILESSYSDDRDFRAEGMRICRADEPAYVGRRTFDHDTGKYIRSLKVAQWLEEKLPERDRDAYIVNALREIGKCLGAGHEARRLRLACRWFFDSSASSDDVTAFVQAMIVMETVLGEGASFDRNSISLGELLKNRCAFLLGKTRSERDDILAAFAHLYRVRSAIVHHGQHKLSYSERTKLFELKDLCARVIRAEGRLLANDE
jgi:hypothetical protein